MWIDRCPSSGGSSPSSRPPARGTVPGACQVQLIYPPRVSSPRGVDPLFASLRTHALAALGLSSVIGCAGSSSGDRDDSLRVPPPPPELTTTKIEEPPIPAEDHSRHCGPDELRDVACTESKGVACAASQPFSTNFYISDIDAWGSQAAFTHDPGLSSDMTAIEPKRPKCCYSRCTPLKVAASAPVPVAPPNSDLGVSTFCQPMPDAPSRFPAPGAERCAAAVVRQNGTALRPFHDRREGEAVGRRAKGWTRDLCCYDDLVDRRGVGRAYRVEGRRTLARDEAPSFDPVAAHWHDVARGEHASIFAFAALAASLEAHDAPAELVRAARRAERDEGRHARFAYGWLERVSGARVRPGPLPAPSTPADLETLAREALVDGAFEESLGAALAAHLAEVSDDETLASALRTIAREEARHAELSWRVLSFALAREPGLAATLHDDLARLEDLATELGGSEDAALERAGVPSRVTTRALATRVLREIVTPCLEAALAPTPIA